MERQRSRNKPIIQFAAQSLGGVAADNVDHSGKLYDRLDRKSTRLNSSHVSISYAVFCLKKKKRGDKLHFGFLYIEHLSVIASRLGFRILLNGPAHCVRVSVSNTHHLILVRADDNGTDFG